MKTLFITGTGGFIGSHFLRQIKPKDYKNIYCLTRSKTSNTSYGSSWDNIRFIQGDILNPRSYISYLSKSDIVIHIAAAVGKAKAEEYFNVNAKGTDILIKKCIQSGVKNILYISSIATKFKNIKNYPYAQSKLLAEECVKASGIPNTILRPTIVIGEGSSILSSLSKLGNLPIVPIFGDGSVLIQPIFIEDLISCILHIIENNIFENKTMDIGGPEQVSIENFIRKLHQLSFNRNPRVIHIPFKSIIKILNFLEKHFFSFLPFTSGQLASFSNDGTIDRNRVFDCYCSNMKNVNEMLNLILSNANEIERSKVDLEQECKRFTEYLINCKPDAYIKNKYLEGHKFTNFEYDSINFDSFLIKTASKISFMIKIADVYTTVFYRKALLRKKLVLLLAVLESCPSTYSIVDSVCEHSKFSLFIKTIQKTFVFMVLLLLSSIVFFPFQIMFYLRSSQPKKAS